MDQVPSRGFSTEFRRIVDNVPSTSTDEHVTQNISDCFVVELGEYSYTEKIHQIKPSCDRTVEDEEQKTEINSPTPQSEGFSNLPS